MQYFADMDKYAVDKLCNQNPFQACMQTKKTFEHFVEHATKPSKVMKYLEELYFPNVNLAVKPTAAGSKLISVTRFSSGFQSSERFKGMLANL